MTPAHDTKGKPMLLAELPPKEAAIIARLSTPDRPSFSPEAAEGILAIGFSQSDNDRMKVLAAKAREGSMTAQEQDEAEAYSRIGSVLGILKSMARRTLKGRNGTNRNAKTH
jgi:hypothetical protein